MLDEDGPSRVIHPVAVDGIEGHKAHLCKNARAACEEASSTLVSSSIGWAFTHHEQDYHGMLKFATDTWTSPNHRAYMALVVYFVEEGETEAKPTSALLNIVEVAESHTGDNLAEVFRDVLEEFGIKEKVSSLLLR